MIAGMVRRAVAAGIFESHTGADGVEFFTPSPAYAAASPEERAAMFERAGIAVGPNGPP
jgi:hypothetical protein